MHVILDDHMRYWSGEHWVQNYADAKEFGSLLNAEQYVRISLHDNPAWRHVKTYSIRDITTLTVAYA